MSLTTAAVFFLYGDASIHGSRRVLFACFLALMAFMASGARKGYARGPIRQLTTVLVLVVTVAGAWFAGPAFGHWVLKSTMTPWLLRGLLGMLLLGSILWLVTFAVFWRFGRPRVNDLGETEHPVLGSIIGCWTGILWYFFSVLLVAALASLAQFWLDSTSSSEDGFGRSALRKTIVLKNSVALYPGLDWLRTWNPIPARVRNTLEKGVLVFNTPGALIRLQRQPAIRSLATDPAFYPLTQDEEIRELVKNHDLEGLLDNPRVRQLLADDDFQRKIAETDLEALFDAALSGSGGSRLVPIRPPATSSETAPPPPPIRN